MEAYGRLGDAPIEKRVAYDLHYLRICGNWSLAFDQQTIVRAIVSGLIS